MDKHTVIDQAKTQRNRQKLLNQALAECTTQIMQFSLDERRRHNAFWREHEDDDVKQAAAELSKAAQERRQAIIMQQTANIRQLVAQGADINVHVAALDRNGQPTHTTTLLNFLLAVENYTFYPLAQELVGQGAQIDNGTVQWLGQYACNHQTKHKAPVHSWFRDLADRAMEVAGLDWTQVLDDSFAHLKRMSYKPPAPSILAVNAVDRYYEGFLDRLHAAQDARGELRTQMLVPIDISKPDADKLLHDIVLRQQHYGSDGRLSMIRQLVGLGADPLWKPSQDATAKNALEAASTSLDGPLVAVLLSRGAHASVAQAHAATAAALESAHMHTNLPTPARETNDQLGRGLVGVMRALHEAGVNLDLSELIEWNDVRVAAMSVTRKRATITAALDEHLPGLSGQLRAMLDGKTLDEGTVQTQDTAPRPRL